MFDGTSRSLGRDQHRNRASFDQKHQQRPTHDDESDGEDERRQRQGLREQHRGHGRNDLSNGQREQVAGVPADEEHRKKHPADDWHGEQCLEQRVGNELDDDDVPVGGNDEGAALETVLERHGAPGERISDRRPRTLRQEERPALRPDEDLIVRDNDRESMSIPHFVRRAAGRVMVGGVICALVVAIVGVLGERSRFGRDLAAARQRIESDVREQFGSLNGELEAIASRLRNDPAVIGAASARDTAATRQLFDRLAAATAGSSNLAITVYGPEARPIAWAGRPATDLPIVRLVGPDALFLAPSPLGLRLTRVSPVNDPRTPERRVATLVAEAPLPRTAGSAQAQSGLIVETSVVPVPLRPGFEGAADAVANAIVLRTPAGEPLAAIDVPVADIERARAGWRTRVLAAEAVVLCLALLLLCGPLLDWRRLIRTVPSHLGLTIAVLGLLLLSRLVAWFAVRQAGFDSPVLLSRQLAGPYWVALASPLDFLLTMFALGGHRRGGGVEFRAVAPKPSSSSPGGSGSRAACGRAVPDGATGRGWPGRLPALRLRRLRAIAIGARAVRHRALLAASLGACAAGGGDRAGGAARGARRARRPDFPVGDLALGRGATLRWIRAWIPVLWAAPAVAVLVSLMRNWERPLVAPPSW